ncbi:mycofactocin dehydrogenase MftG [Antrihabitans cavernicola]|uniref:Mycofactocin system GMC family oxidoreductase MftG n=1 Tax=Antrihabitans cavernicola TaxID=2495913 RepID=A0A5A7S738_9NOCA|nr:mycofactocin system GMC family oxidoreductase MftG [Spelaeibacter cavernicola]KAA0018388.1 mycofactocin system GMC family oxidoreductase MftG [Spelaeibacter cavernicola]
MGRTAEVLIVGGGTCGCVLAARLSEQSDRTVLLVEAGPGFDETPDSLRDPTAMAVGPESVWARRYPAALTATRSGVAVRGRVLGGSSAVNGGYFVRGTAADFDGWGGAWSYDKVLPYFRKSEHDLDFDGEYHGGAGPIRVRRDRADEFVPLSAEFAQVCVSAGFARCADLNAPGFDGVGSVPMNIDRGARITTAAAYLAPALVRSNLRVETKTVVQQLVIESGRAVGIVVERGGVVDRYYADRIVLCAGAIESAALLMRSGIGDPERLRAAGVSTRYALPAVGAAFADHPEVAVPYRLLASSESKAVAALQVILGNGGVELRPYTAAMDLLVPGSGMDVPYLGVALMQSESRGVVTVRSDDPAVPPDIEYRYLSAAADRTRLREGVQLAQELLAALASRGVLTFDHIDPTDDWMSANLGTSQHMMGTCPMGADGVVDENCAVHGVDALYVVDTSVIPNNLSRGPNATAVMIAERAAALLR